MVRLICECPGVSADGAWIDALGQEQRGGGVSQIIASESPHAGRATSMWNSRSTRSVNQHRRGTFDAKERNDVAKRHIIESWLPKLIACRMNRSGKHQRPRRRHPPQGFGRRATASAVARRITASRR
jgi:hypothetical protein